MTLLKRALALASAAALAPALAAAQTAPLNAPSSITPITGVAFGTYGAAPTTVSAANPLPVTSSEAAASTNGSTTVTAGGTYQTVFASNTSRKGCTIQNPTTATEILSVRVKSVAVFTVPIGGAFNCANPGGLVISDLIEVTAATTGHAFTALSQ